ncbi:MAG: prephenate dehydratase [Acidimicrobiaceae bacterium]|nr:prephenate dehydratase [Acidimicrobiaceae bacterium]
MGQLGESRNLTVGYLGPPGTFTEQAIYSQPDLAAMNHRPINSIIDVLKAVSSGEVDLGLVAIENMIEGSVTATLDALAFDTDLYIQREVIIDVNLNLLARPGVRMESIERVRSYPVAHAQCRSFMAERLPDAVFEAANSTADAARNLAGSTDVATAVIAPVRSAEVYGLEVLAADIADHAENQTRFVLVREGVIAAPTGHDKTSMVIYQRSDVPGSLIGILQEFAARAINLTSLQSRPTKASLGQYCFLIDCEGHIADEVVADALRNLSMKTTRVKFLGSYPSASADHHDHLMNEVELRKAVSWIEDLRGRIGS